MRVVHSVPVFLCSLALIVNSISCGTKSSKKENNSTPPAAKADLTAKQDSKEKKEFIAGVKQSFTEGCLQSDSRIEFCSCASEIFVLHLKVDELMTAAQQDNEEKASLLIDQAAEATFASPKLKQCPSPN